MEKKDFIKDGLSNEEIILTIKKIIERNKEDDIRKLTEMDKYEKLKEEFNFFSDRYPMLFELSTRNENFNWNNLFYMLNMRNKIINDEMTSEDASKVVGKDWYDKYVDIKSIPKNKKHKN